MIRLATLQDIPAIQHIASLTWPVAYAAILPASQLSYMMAKMYNAEVLTHQMAVEGQLFFILEKNGRCLGFAGTSPNSHPPPSNLASHPWKLHKLYVLPFEQKIGAGKMLLQKVEETVKAAGGNYLTLNVNRSNAAFQFYVKNGFTVLESGDFDIGQGFFMQDYVMGKLI